jgi:ABC-type xylose transport system permease subunit
MYVGIIAVACIKLGSLASIVAIAKFAVPWFVGSFATVLAGYLVYMGILLAITRQKLRGTGISLNQLMALPQEERHAFLKDRRRGPYRDA